ncbi:MAG: fibrobacter succinogenes major paralogous domain-containing protein [Bacteroidales bacterium]|nr:fibrobacter succinogenes major paralogous domain-containing protein [Bacteroidales bacterium]
MKQKQLNTAIICITFLAFTLKVKSQGYSLDKNAENSPGSGTTTKTTDKLTDIDGNTYITIKIGDQWWMAENLRTTRYNDGTEIPLVTDNDEWAKQSTPAYCWCYNDKDYALSKNYGALYNWYTVNTDKLCPDGWHVPTDEEWRQLEKYVIAINPYLGKALAATTGWSNSNTPGHIGNNTSTNNASGFSALPGGSRNHLGSFAHSGYGGVWWNSTQKSKNTAYYHTLYNSYPKIYRNSLNKSYGFSIRCVKD